LNRAVAGQLEALPKAAGPYAEGVGDLDVPATGGAVGQGGRGRDVQKPSIAGSCVALGCQCSWHSGQAHEQKTHANYQSGGTHCDSVIVCFSCCWCWCGLGRVEFRIYGYMGIRQEACFVHCLHVTYTIYRRKRRVTGETHDFWREKATHDLGLEGRSST
jgi:hypothetical protein